MRSIEAICSVSRSERASCSSRSCILSIRSRETLPIFSTLFQLVSRFAHSDRVGDMNVSANGKSGGTVPGAENGVKATRYSAGDQNVTM